mmetsp:Transcript_9567/g.17961  ORF Transcript_9567/g.17961 Transcript_9567/m.17961 type:complete len:92 (+) Transcript_9567:1309-1584(+)
MCIMLQEKLFQVEECSFMGHMLSNLDNGMPCTLRIICLTILTLLITLNKFNNSGLLHYRSIHNFFLHSNFNLQSHRVRLCPNPNCVNKFEL